MRVTINVSGGIVSHGDTLAGGGVIEFPINEPPEFASTLANYTVTGQVPVRTLNYQGHEVAVETTSAAAQSPGLNDVVVQQNEAVGLDILGLAGQSDHVVRIRQNDATGDALLITGEGPDANGPYLTRSLVEVYDWQGNPLLDLRDTGRFLLSASNVGGNFAIFQVKDDGGVIRLQLLNDGTFVLSGAVVKMTGLPTSDPTVAGQLWNDAGTLKVSAG
jgi:hypothetical protein